MQFKKYETQFIWNSSKNILSLIYIKTKINKGAESFYESGFIRDTKNSMRYMN